MAVTTATAPQEQQKRSRLPLVAGLVLAVAGGGGGFYAVHSGLLPGSGAAAETHAEEASPSKALPMPDVSFVEVPPLIVSLGPSAQSGHLRFRASLEVPKAHEAEVEALLPRVQDVLNSYLRALDPRDIEAQGALFKLRAQMLRRVRMVAGDERVRDLLVLEFVLN